jgi:hypothetical protein
MIEALDFDLVVADSRPKVMATWQSTLGWLPKAAFLTVPISLFRSSAALDALVLPAVIAHERLGGELRCGTSQVLNAGAKYELPAWVVTTPAFEGVMSPDQTGSQQETTISMLDNWSDAAEWRIIFREIIRCTASFNKASQRIRSLGIHLELLDASESEREQQALGAARAFREYLGQA